MKTSTTFKTYYKGVEITFHPEVASVVVFDGEATKPYHVEDMGDFATLADAERAIRKSQGEERKSEKAKVKPMVKALYIQNANEGRYTVVRTRYAKKETSWHGRPMVWYTSSEGHTSSAEREDIVADTATNRAILARVAKLFAASEKAQAKGERVRRLMVRGLAKR